MPLLKVSLSLLILAVVAMSEDIEVVNNCGTNIYVKNEGGNTGGFMLRNRGSKRFQVNAGDDRPRVWAHKGCNSDGRNCETSEGEVSLAEMHWDGDNNRKTWYDISQVDGYNLPITIQPFNPNAGGRCETVRCNFNLNNCPGEAQVKKGNRIVACKNNNRDDPNSNYARNMKSQCPNAYSWSGDDRSGMRDCIRGNSGLRVIFC